MGFALQVFVSSACYELRDLRAVIGEWLKSFGMTPLMSNEGGFPHFDGMPPYASCLRVLEGCPLVIGVIDRGYGRPFDDWGPYPQFRGCSPTHAELRHALDEGKRLLLFVHEDIWNFYEVWSKSKIVVDSNAPAGLDEATLQMFEEFKRHSSTPWISRFSNVTDLRQSLNDEFVNQLYLHLSEREKETRNLADHLLKRIEEASPEVRAKIEAGLNPKLVEDRNLLRNQLDAIEVELEQSKGATQTRMNDLEAEKSAAQARLEIVTKQLSQASLLLGKAATKDAAWLNIVRTTMMPRQPGRVPFHNAAEVAMRGFHARSRLQPTLREVTWSLLPYREGGLHRGYHAGIIFKGVNFDPGVTTTFRRCGEGLPAGQNDYFWRTPNIYFGDYLEISTSNDEVEGPLSWRDYEFQVRNPEGQRSEWIPFTYPFDDLRLNELRAGYLEQGKKFLDAGTPAEATEFLRKAWVFSDRMLGIEHPETVTAKALCERARNEAALEKLRFRVGDKLKISAGPHEGVTGIVEQLLLNHAHAYAIRPAEGGVVHASDVQVEVAEP